MWIFETRETNFLLESGSKFQKQFLGGETGGDNRLGAADILVSGVLLSDSDDLFGILSESLGLMESCSYSFMLNQLGGHCSQKMPSLLSTSTKMERLSSVTKSKTHKIF